MHVMLCYSIYPPIQAGGAELIVSNLATGLVRRGHRVTVVSTCGPQMEPYPTEQQDGVEVVRFFPPNRYWLFERDGRRGLDKLRWHARDAWNRGAARQLGSLMRRYAPDLVHTHGVEGFSPALWQTVRNHGLPLVHTAHDYYMICPRALMLTRNLNICAAPGLACRTRSAWYLRCARAIDVFCSPSRFLLDTHLAGGLAVPHSAVVPNGIPMPDGAPKTFNLDPRQPLRLLFAGRLTPEKGVRVVIDAMRHVPAGHPVELTIAGRGPLADEAGIAAQFDPRITFAGYVSGAAKARAFATADCLLLPSLWYENAPTVILEAASHRLPVIASRMGAIPEFVHHDRNGLLFEPGNPAALAAAVMRLARDRAQVERLGQGGSVLLQRHRVDSMLDAYLQQYQRLLDRRIARAS